MIIPAEIAGFFSSANKGAIDKILSLRLFCFRLPLKYLNVFSVLLTPLEVT
jgi:hypothetical protein